MKIVIDTREPEDVVMAFLKLQEEKKDEFELERKMLEIGDVLVDDKIVFERKSGSDYVSSITDGRLASQAKSMEAFPYRFVIFEGSLWDYVSAITPRAVIGMQSSMAVRNKIWFLHVQNSDGFVWAVYTTAKKIYEEEVKQSFIKEENK